MKKREKTMWRSCVAAAVLFAVAAFILPTAVPAASKVVAIEGMSYDANASLADNLKSLTGKKVSITVDSGRTFSGILKAVGDHLVHLEKLDGKEYYDALIPIDRISALEARFREYQQ